MRWATLHHLSLNSWRVAAILGPSLVSPGASRLATIAHRTEAHRGFEMRPRKPSEKDPRTTARESRLDAGVRAALRARRRRRADEAGLQGLVRRLASETSSGSGG